MSDRMGKAAYYSLLDDGFKAAEMALQQFRSASDSQLTFIYVGAEPPEDGPVNLIYAPIDQLPALFLQTTLPLPEKFFPGDRGLPDAVIDHERNHFFSVLEGIEKIRAENLQGTRGSLLSIDTFFIQKSVAYAVALQQNRVDLGHPNIDGLQVCYYEGDAIDAGPENLVNIVGTDLVTFFTETRLRLPAHLVIPPGVSEQDKQDLQDGFRQLRIEVLENREKFAGGFLSSCKELAPPRISPGTPLTIYLPANRLTEVMQYASKGLADAFEKLGHRVCLSIEKSEMEMLHFHRFMDQYELNPNVVVNINHLNNEWLHPHTYNVTWWQDPMKGLVEQVPFNWRERDLVFSVYPDLDNLLMGVKAPEVHRQGFCIDSELFSHYPEVVREHKAVFIGSSYNSKLGTLVGSEEKLLSILEASLSAGEQIEKEWFWDLAKEMDIGIPRASLMLSYVIRDNTVRWLCEADDIEVEVYGRGWDYDPVIKPYFKGQLNHGADVAKAYNSATYVLAALPSEINTQRLAEAAACGCVPVVWDCRYRAEPPFWDDECLFFRTREQLHHCLTQRPPSGPEEIARHFSYERFAQRIVDMIYSMERQE